jgi:aminotransferase EvaB
MQINDLSARIGAHEAQISAAINRVLRSGWVVLGPEVRQFESAFADYVQVRHCIGVANGTEALEIALRAVGVRPGDQVATVGNAGMYSTLAALSIGAEPRFMDVDLATRNVGLAEVQRALQAGARAIVLTHLYGSAVREAAEIAAACAAAKVPLVEDCAQAHGARTGGQQVGSFGQVACFSFYPTKNLGALGDAGAVVTSDDALAARIRQLRQYGWSSKYTVELAGARNSRLDEMQAAILSVFLPGLAQANARRREIAARYAAGIRHEAVTLPVWGEADVAHLYVVRTRERESLRAHLKAAGIGTDVHYPVPDHRQPVFGDRFQELSLPHTERLAQEVLTLPCYPEMSDADVDQVAAAVNAWSRQGERV